MSGDDRKPVIIAIVCAAVAVAVLALGIGFGGRDESGGEDWQDRLAGIGAVAPLTTADLSLTAGSCELAERQVVVSGSCSFTIAPFGGPFDLGAATKQADATFTGPATSRLEVRMIVEGTEVAQEAELGTATTLTVGRAGGSLTLICAGVEPCVLEIA
jgi:hypothetical protein